MRGERFFGDFGIGFKVSCLSDCRSGLVQLSFVWRERRAVFV